MFFTDGTHAQSLYFVGTTEQQCGHFAGWFTVPWPVDDVGFSWVRTKPSYRSTYHGCNGGTILLLQPRPIRLVFFIMIYYLTVWVRIITAKPDCDAENIVLKIQTDFDKLVKGCTAWREPGNIDCV